MCVLKMKALILFLVFLNGCYGFRQPPRKCLGVACPTPLCANPVTPPGRCCPTCDHSLCKFQGCVQFLGPPGSKTVQWKPDRCGSCKCSENGQPMCSGKGCPQGPRAPGTVLCNGRPQVTLPWECCPVCDYGTPQGECNVVVDKKLTYKLSTETVRPTCSIDLTFHTCDKRGFMNDQGVRFECTPVRKQVTVQPTGSCGIAKPELVFEDVVDCSPVRNDNLEVGCDITV